MQARFGMNDDDLNFRTNLWSNKNPIEDLNGILIYSFCLMVLSESFEKTSHLRGGR